MADTLASLVVNLQVETAQLRKGLDDANAKLNAFGKGAQSVGKMLAGAFSVVALKSALESAFGAISGMVTSGAQAADAMVKMAQAAGQPVESFSKLAYAADLSGVSTEQLSGAMSKLNKAMSEAATGKNKEAAGVFQALGVSVKDAAGHLRSSDQVMADLAESFSKLQDGPAKSALAMELFGKTGAALIPLLNSGKDGLAQMGREAEDLGIVIDGRTARAAEHFNDNITRLNKAGEGLSIVLSAKLAPALIVITDKLVAMSKGVQHVMDNLNGLAAMVQVVGRVTSRFGGIFGAVGVAVEAAGEALDFTATKLDELQENTKDAEQAVKQSADAAAEAAAKFEEAERRKAAAANKAAEEIREAQQSITSMAVLGANTSDQFADKQRAFSRAQAGATGPDTRGFETFEQALEASARATLDAAAQMSLAKAYEKAEMYDSARAAELLANELSINARSASAAADAFIQIESATTAASQALIEKSRQEQLAIEAARQQAADQASGNMLATIAGPRVTGIVNAGMQGAALGPQGAVAGVAIGLLAQSKQFAALMETVDGIIQGLADGLGALLEPIALLLEPLEPLGLIFGVVGKIMAEYLRPGIELMAQVLKVVVSVLLTVWGGIGKVWNAIIGAVQSVLSAIGKFEIAGQRPFKFLDDWAKSLERSKANVLALEDAQKKLWEEQEEVVKTVAPPAGEAGKALYAMAKTTKDAAETFHESLTNMVSGYKLAGPRFDSSVGLIALNAKQQPAPTVNVYVDGQQVEPDRVEVERPVATVQPLLIAQYG